MTSTRSPFRRLRLSILTCIIAAISIATLQTATIGSLPLLMYILYTLFFILLPGLFLLQVICGPSGPKPSLLLFAYPLGILLEFYTFLILCRIDQSSLAFFAGPVLSLCFLLLAMRYGTLHRIARTASALIDRHGIPLSLLILLFGTAYWLLSVKTTGHPASDTYAMIYPDISFIISNAHAILRSFPPELLSMKGIPHIYHYGVEVHLAAAHVVTGLDLLTLQIRLLGLEYIVFMAMAAYALGLSLTNRSRPAALLVAVLFFFGSNPTGQPATHTLHTLLVPGSYLYSMIFLLPVLYSCALLAQSETRGTRLSLLLALMLVGTISAKGILYPALIVPVVLFIAFRARATGNPGQAWPPGQAWLVLLTAVPFILWYLLLFSRAIGERFGIPPLPLPSAVTSIMPGFILRGVEMLVPISITGGFAQYGAAFARGLLTFPLIAMVLYPWQTALVALGLLTKGRGRTGILPFLLATSLILNILINIFDFGSNANYFLAYMQITLTAAAVAALFTCQWIASYRVFLLAALVAGASAVGIWKIRSQAIHYGRFTLIHAPAENLYADRGTLSHLEFDALQYLKRHTPSDAVVQSDRLDEAQFTYSAYSERQFFCETPSWSGASPALTSRVLNTCLAIYTSGNPDSTGALLKKHGIGYLIHSRRFCPVPAFDTAGFVRRIFENDHMVIYRTVPEKIGT